MPFLLVVLLTLGQGTPPDSAEPQPAAGSPSEVAPTPEEPSPEPTPPPARKRSKVPVEVAPPVARPAGGAPPSPSPAPLAGPAPRPRSSGPDVAATAVAERFLAALAGRRRAELAALCAPTFSFDGRPARSAEEVRRRWEEALAHRTSAPERVEGLEVVPTAEALNRLGKPPRRLEAVMAAASQVALARVGGRPVGLFLVRQGGGWLVAGMTD